MCARVLLLEALASQQPAVVPSVSSGTSSIRHLTRFLILLSLVLPYFNFRSLFASIWKSSRLLCTNLVLCHLPQLINPSSIFGAITGFLKRWSNNLSVKTVSFFLSSLDTFCVPCLSMMGGRRTLSYTVQWKWREQTPRPSPDTGLRRTAWLSLWACCSLSGLCRCPESREEVPSLPGLLGVWIRDGCLISSNIFLPLLRCSYGFPL